MEKVKQYLKTIDKVIAEGEYKDSWQSLSKYKVPEWYRTAKFGVMIHWGVYSVPAFSSEWYPRDMYIKDSKVYKHHIETYGPHKDFGYKQFIPMFRAEKFNAEEWAELFHKSGAGFVMPVAEHHDGFQMYDSDLSDYTSVKMGPKKDILGALKQAVHADGMEFAASSHRLEHYFFLSGGKKFESDITEVPYGDLYWPSVVTPGDDVPDTDHFEMTEEYMEDWLVRCCEIVDRYQPKVFFFDWFIETEVLKPYLRKFAAYYYNRAAEWGTEVVLTYKFDACMYGTAVNDIERGQLDGISPRVWQSDTSVAKNSWSYTENNEYKASSDIICDLVDIVSKNGVLLLNVGPKADGTIPEEDAKILRDIGEWLTVNGEGIYGAECWKIYGEGPTEIPHGTFTDTLRSQYTDKDFRFTFKDGCLYAYVMSWPESGEVKIPALGHRKRYFGLIEDLEILGYAKKPEYNLTEECLTVTAPDVVPVVNAPVAIKIHLG